MTDGLQILNARYVSSAVRPDQYPVEDRPEIAFLGRSNVGKSSLINSLCRHRGLALVSGRPGKTQTINFFAVNAKIAEVERLEWFLVDLPGYGYAKVSRSEKERWARLMEAYFQDKQGLITLGVLIVDARHKPTADDCTMHNWFCQTGCPEIVVANKLDKLRPREIEPALALIRQTLELPESEPLLPFSAEKGTGRQELAALLESTGQ